MPDLIAKGIPVLADHAPGRQAASANSRLSLSRSLSIGKRRPSSSIVPEGPAVAGRQALRQRADLVDRADRGPPSDERAVGPHEARCVAPRASVSEAPGVTRPRSTTLQKRNARLAALAPAAARPLSGGKRRDRGDPCARGRRVAVVPLDADEARAPAPSRRRPSCPMPKKGSSTTSPGLRGGEHDARAAGPPASASDASCGPPSSFSRSLARADRKQPVRAHLQVVVAGLQRFVIEGVTLGLRVRAAQIKVSCALVKRRPRKFGIGFALRQTMSFSIQKPRSCSIGADAENVVIGADHPKVAFGFITRRTSLSQARVKRSYSAKLANLSQSSSTASTTL